MCDLAEDRSVDADHSRPGAATSPPQSGMAGYIVDTYDKDAGLNNQPLNLNGAPSRR